MAGEVGMFMVRRTSGNILCCKCSIRMTPTDTNMCAKCMVSEFDFTQNLRKRFEIVHCRKCDSYLQQPTTWIKAPLGSNDLLDFCLRKLKKNWDGVKIVFAQFDWTEPHSKRIKVKLSVQDEVLSGNYRECYVDYVVRECVCNSCMRVQGDPDQWVAVVQVRQHVAHRRTFLYLEQVILKHHAADDAVRIKQMDRGVDFFFHKRSHGQKFVDFLGKFAPIRSPHGRPDKKLVSHDTKSNNYNYKFAFSVEICPVCREDLIYLPSSGNFGRLVICTKVRETIYLVDPFTLEGRVVCAENYWRAPFKSLLTSRQLVEYIVLDVEIISPQVDFGGKRYALADAQVARVSDFGKNDTIFSIRTHLGNLLKPGDYAFGYDLHGANISGSELDNDKRLILLDAILVKKSYEEKHRRNHGKPRSWRLKSLNMEIDDSKGRDEQEKMNLEYEQFWRDLEENPDMRSEISLYHNREYQLSEMMSMTDGEDVTSVPLHELLADLDLSDEEDGIASMRE